jgi:hypothetical protein
VEPFQRQQLLFRDADDVSLFVHLGASLGEQVPGFGILHFNAGLEHELIRFFNDACDQLFIEQG